jgi:hypothetical protein
MGKDFLYSPFVPVSPDRAWRGRDKTEQTYSVYVRTQHGHRLPSQITAQQRTAPPTASLSSPPSTVSPHTYNRACPIYRVHVSIPPSPALPCIHTTPPGPTQAKSVDPSHQPTHPHTHTPAREVTLHATYPRQPQQHQVPSKHHQSRAVCPDPSQACPIHCGPDSGSDDDPDHTVSDPVPALAAPRSAPWDFDCRKDTVRRPHAPPG